MTKEPDEEPTARTVPLSPRPEFTPAAPPILTLEHVAVTFDNHPVLHDINLAVPRGQTLVVLGESGCGKTVLLKLLIGLLRPTRGRVTFDGRVLADLDDREL